MPEVKKKKKVNGSKLANDLYGLKEQISAANLAVSKTKEGKLLTKLTAKKKELEVKALEYLNDEDLASVDGGEGKIGINESIVPTVEDWPKFHAWIKKTGNIHFLNKAVKVESVRDYWEETKKKVPGVNKFTVKKLSVTKGKKAK